MDFSLNNVKKNINWLILAFFGLFHWVIWAMPYFGGSVSFGDYSMSESLSGYKIMTDNFTEMDAAGFGYFMNLLTMIFVVLMLLASAYMLVQRFVTSITLPDEFGPINADKISPYVLYAYAGLNALTFIGLIIAGIANSEKSDYGNVSFYPAFGIWFVLILSVGVIVGLKVVEKKFPELLGEGGSSASSKARYVCSVCGANAKTGATFCPECGGKINVIKPLPKPIRVCQQCGAKAAGNAPFCVSCGGKVVERLPSVFACSSCNAIAPKGAKFCSKCGGAVTERFPKAPTCTNCGKIAVNGEQFCAQCGSQVEMK